MTDDKQASEQRTERCYYCSDDFPEGELTTTADNCEACTDCLTGDKCWNCEEPVAFNSGSITDADRDIWCESCANDHLGWCERCEEYSSNDDLNVVDDDTMCDGCVSDIAHYCNGCEAYHYDDNPCGNSKEHIKDRTRKRQPPEQGYQAMRGSLLSLPSTAGAEWAYGDLLHNFKHTNRYLPRNAGSVGVDGWFKVPLEVESPLHKEVANTLYWAVKSDTAYTFHHSRKEADYHPLRDLFRFAFTSERLAESWTFNPEERVYGDALRRSAIATAVRENMLPNGSKLTRKLSRLFARYRKHPDHPGDDYIQSGNWPIDFERVNWSPSKHKERTGGQEVWATFQTNACYLKVVGQLGWDTAALKDLVKHAGNVGSCQSRSHNEDYGFGAASLLCNDYRILFFRNADSDEIVARSVVRYYRHGRFVMLAPSRLYLSEGNSSGSYHLATFDMLTRFCEAANKRSANGPQPRSQGRFTQRLTWLPVAYSKTNHSGGDSITSHLMEAGRGKYVARPLSEVIGYSGGVWTDYSPTFWLETPGDENADFHYYSSDEELTIQYCRITGGDGSAEQGSFQYAIRTGTMTDYLTAYTPIGG